MSGPGTAVQTSFAGGELDVGLRNRLDWQKRDSGAEEIANGLVLPTGGVVKRGGFRFVGEALHHDRPVTLIEFEFSADQVYMLEFGDGVMRLYWDGGIVLNPDGSEYRIVTPYIARQAAECRRRQDRDAMFFSHIEVAPQRLVRHGHTDWRWTEMFADVDRIGTVTGLDWYDEASNGHNNVEYAVTAYRTISGARQESIGYQQIQALPPTMDPIGSYPQSTIQSCINWINTYRAKYGHLSGYPSYPQEFDLSGIAEDASPVGGQYLHPKILAVFKLLFPAAAYGYRNWYYSYTQSGGGRYRFFWGIYWNAKLPTAASDDALWYVYYGQITGSGNLDNFFPYPEYQAKVAAHNYTWFMRDTALDLINTNQVAANGQTKDSIYNAIMTFITRTNTNNSVRAVNRVKWQPTSGAEGG